ncbi:MAG: hypothetical protein AAF747_00735 [Planctomycetota bacterium]
MVLYSAADLIWATRIKGTADQLGVPCRPARDVAMLEARLADSDVRALILDLEAPEPALAMLNRLRGPEASDEERRIRVMAFGPHVAVELFQQARDAGANDVLARGAFDRHLPDLLLQLEARG